MTGLLELLRVINVPLLLAATLVTAIRVNDMVPTLSTGRRLIYTGHVVLPAAATIGSAVKYVRHAPVDPTVAGLTLAAVLILTGAWMTRGESRDAPPPPRPR